ncbi:MAG: arylamine N-acetyltransferase [Bryobacteraceae bacterium]|nr:arylamine N-acetyltransferase [Bryobacteraceae bacterium]
MSDSALPEALRESVLRRLGFHAPPAADLEGLRAIYGAWCANVPFDNVRKVIAIVEGWALPGRDAGDFFDNWLSAGTGATCWPTSNAICELVRSLGFEARRVAGSMRDIGTVNHGSVVVTLGGGDWLIDTSMLTNLPLPLNRESFYQHDAVFAASVEYAGEAYVVWTRVLPQREHMPCRLHTEAVTRDYCIAKYEESRRESPFNRRLYARRNRPGELIVLHGNMRFRRTAEGTTSGELSREEICEALCTDIGLSAGAVEQWARADTSLG